MGFVVRQLGTNDYWHPKQVSITCTAQGYVYHDLQEALIPEMTLRFLTDHKSIIEDLDFIVMEKTVHDNVIQMGQSQGWTKNKTISNTVITETSLRSHLMSLPWAPPFVVKPCNWWRETTGVKATGTDNLSTRETYKQNKQVSIDAFRERFGQEHYQLLLEDTPENQAEDIIEAYWLGEAVQLRWDEIQSELQMVNNYNAVLYPSVRTRIPAVERLGSWTLLPSHSVETHKETIQRYHRYEKDRKRKKTSQAVDKDLKRIGITTTKTQTQTTTTKKRKTTQTTTKDKPPVLKVYKKFKDLE
jgi:hypothetical protein